VTARPLGSVVIPAHNERAVIGACLAPLAPLVADGTVEVVVVCNGCTDDTASVAGAFAGVRVVELPVGSKPAALRAGDRAVTAPPRIYLDADVVLAPEAARTVLARLDGSDGRTAAVAARPPVRYDAAGSGPLVRRCYRARSRIPAVLGSLWGRGSTRCPPPDAPASASSPTSSLPHPPPARWTAGRPRMTSTQPLSNQF
jgi:glycosyltransferase involved in cell wall biosynthesis